MSPFTRENTKNINENSLSRSILKIVFQNCWILNWNVEISLQTLHVITVYIWHFTGRVSALEYYKKISSDINTLFLAKSCKIVHISWQNIFLQVFHPFISKHERFRNIFYTRKSCKTDKWLISHDGGWIYSRRGQLGCKHSNLQTTKAGTFPKTNLTLEELQTYKYFG